MIVFEAWPKTPRMNRSCIVTEKIDGTNAAVIVEPAHPHALLGDVFRSSRADAAPSLQSTVVQVGELLFEVGAQSRNRLIAPGKSTDNAGFAGWVWENAHALAATLGAGRHFGEWWGRGIQHGYGLEDRRLSLFNVDRYGKLDLSSVPALGTVPVLSRGVFDTVAIDELVEALCRDGSVAAPGQRAEGVIVFHAAGRHTYKVLCEGDERPKSVAA